MRTLRIPCLLLLAATVALAACGDDDAQDNYNHANNNNGGGPTFPACDPDALTQTISFVHVNDMHATYHTVGGQSPAARIRGFYEQTRAENPFTLFTNGGDDHEKGSVAELLSEGWSTLEVVHAMAFDVRVIGNHDFAWGSEELLAFSRDPHGIVLASNTEYTGNDATAFGAVAWSEIQVGCLRVGFFGMVSKPWNENNEQFTGDYLPDLHTRYDYVDRARGLIAAHRGHVDLVVMVSHLGRSTDERVADKVDGIHAILGGHSHSVLATPTVINGAAIIQTGAYAAFVARLDLDVDLGTGAVLERRYDIRPNLAGELPVNAAIQVAVDDILRRWAPDYDVAVTFLAQHRDLEEVATLAAVAATDVHGLDGALVDVEEVWAPWAAGPLTPQRLLDTFKVERQPANTPGFNSFYEVTLSGDHLRRLRDDLSPSRWALVAPPTLEDATSYRIAVQKHVAFNVGRYLPDGVSLNTPTPLAEVWATLDAYARLRTDLCFHLDEDTPLAACP